MSQWADSFTSRFGQQLNDLTGVSAQNASNARQARDMMSFSAEEANKSRAFTERMSASAHQREVADLRAAGLNPILSGTGGMGAQASSSAMGQAAGFPVMQADVVGAAGAAVNSALSIRRNKAEVANLEASNSNILMDTQKKDKERTYYHNLGQLTDEERQAQEHQNKGRKVEGDIDTGRYGAVLRYLDRLRGTASSASSLFRYIPK